LDDGGLNTRGRPLCADGPGTLLGVEELAAVTAVEVAVAIEALVTLTLKGFVAGNGIAALPLLVADAGVVAVTVGGSVHRVGGGDVGGTAELNADRNLGFGLLRGCHENRCGDATGKNNLREDTLQSICFDRVRFHDILLNHI
jgi:hypothetical protein